MRNLAAGRSVAAIDRRGTGRYGFFVANYGRPMRLYELAPDGRLADVAPGLGLDRTTGGRGLWVGPLVSERSDLFCVNEHGPNFLFRNRGDGTFDEVAAEYRLADPDEHGRGRGGAGRRRRRPARPVLGQLGRAAPADGPTGGRHVPRPGDAGAWRCRGRSGP